ncbi:hypothetical protein PLICRDRAFT_172009 [Plicaturopsis crispa FD-325 SS-3]|nr:hypothetical protein PLICRDRAFT_172009 [Plicaturopsis crispa FD-325 SS-3]
MGSLCSKSNTLSGGHTVLGSSSTAAGGQGQQIGGHSDRPDPRVAAAEAAERRLQAAQSRGTSASNPNRGQLAAKVEKAKTAKPGPPEEREERLVWD